MRPGSAFVLVCSVFLLLPRPSQNPAPWITNELCTLKVAGHQLERLSKRTGLTVHRNAYNIYPIYKSPTPPLSPSWLAQPCSMDPMSTTMVEGSPSHFYYFFYQLQDFFHHSNPQEAQFKPILILITTGLYPFFPQ